MSDKSKRDIISEEEFNNMATMNAPEEDSPGDSEEDAGLEFEAGLNFMPDERNEFEDPKPPQEEKIFNRGLNKEVKEDRDVTLPETAEVVSANKPEPWNDLDTPSDVN